MTKRSGRKWKMEPKIATVMVKRRRKERAKTLLGDNKPGNVKVSGICRAQKFNAVIFRLSSDINTVSMKNYTINC